MAKYLIPSNPGRCHVIESKAGTPLVVNDQKGKNQLHIPCKTWQEAKEVCRRLNEGDHQGVIRA